jgi:hypothetical protein
MSLSEAPVARVLLVDDDDAVRRMMNDECDP